ncbi:hypothetical protein [Novosphingobium pentaromativorans]|uniref:Lipoprotein n=1 Tax=Novosphingobium pentaromativorans US6-1 TaxID=1088721 RepID=G6E7K1_9SPHN|nr:hypothetical protein [Novosphingobium pentaromativorans]AIT81599.1 hypothetical protein JI59_18405 [Novosphingobium pentaromativorans US6-1]EHJ62824.1 hypothetical protein NSU_0336 [Novosphingobium pentaromativorans US6-1]
MRRAILLVGFALTACASEGDKAAEDYEFAKSSPSTNIQDMCDAATRAREAYVRDHDTENVSRWSGIASMDCNRAAMYRR